MRSPAPLSLLEAAPPGDSGGGATWFAAVAPERTRRWPSFLLSLVVHLAGALVMPPLTSPLWEPSDRELWIRQQRIYRSLRIRIPETLYVASSGATLPLPPRQAVSAPQRPARPAAPGSGSHAQEAGRAGRARRKFELPALRRRNSPDTLLQPQFDPDLAPAAALHLPEVFFWTARVQALREVKPFIAPGNTAQPARPRVLDAPPKLEVPVGEAPALPLPSAMQVKAQLPVFSGAALPVKASEPENGVPRTGVSTESGPGDAAALLSLVLDPQRMREFLSVPPGNQLGQQFPAGRGGAITGAAAGTGGNGTQGNGAGTGGTGRPGHGSGAGTGNGQGQGTGPAGGAQAAGSDGAGGASGWRSAALAAAAPSRKLHPAGGVFDVVVLSSSLEGFPESAGVLSGKPVYSVFVSAGGPKDWILQYCIPAEDDTNLVVTGPVVRLGAPTQLTAPYPLVTFRPVLHQKAGHYVMVHGRVTSAGRFEELRVLGRTEPQDAAATLAVLEQWEFRPAARDGRPVRVEVLLAIPAE